MFKLNQEMQSRCKESIHNKQSMAASQKVVGVDTYLRQHPSLIHNQIYSVLHFHVCQSCMNNIKINSCHTFLCIIAVYSFIKFIDLSIYYSMKLLKFHCSQLKCLHSNTVHIYILWFIYVNKHAPSVLKCKDYITTNC